MKRLLKHRCVMCLQSLIFVHAHTYTKTSSRLHSIIWILLHQCFFFCFCFCHFKLLRLNCLKYKNKYSPSRLLLTLLSEFFISPPLKKQQPTNTGLLFNRALISEDENDMFGSVSVNGFLILAVSVCLMSSVPFSVLVYLVV